MKRKYSEDMEKEIAAAYEGCSTQEERDECVEEFAEKWGKPPRSIIAKLSKMKIYVAKERLSSVTGGPARTKEQIARDITRLIGKREEDMIGLDKASKIALQHIKDYILKKREGD